MRCRIRKINQTPQTIQGIPRLLFALLVETTDAPIMIVKGVVAAAAILIVAVGQITIAAGVVLLVAIATGTRTTKGTMTGPLAGVELLEVAPSLTTEILTSAVAGRLCSEPDMTSQKRVSLKGPEGLKD